MTWSWWLVPIALLGLALVFAPVLGRLWVDHDEERARRNR